MKLKLMQNVLKYTLGIVLLKSVLLPASIEDSL